FAIRVIKTAKFTWILVGQWVQIDERLAVRVRSAIKLAIGEHAAARHSGNGVAIKLAEVSCITEVALPHGRSRNYGVVHAVVHVLLVVLGSEEKEQLIAVVVEVRARDDERAADVEARVEVLGFGARKVSQGRSTWIRGAKSPRQYFAGRWR